MRLQVTSGSEKCVTLDVKKGERAMLVKNHNGDWAIVKAKWGSGRSKSIIEAPKWSQKLLTQNTSYPDSDAIYYLQKCLTLHGNVTSIQTKTERNNIYIYIILYIYIIGHF